MEWIGYPLPYVMTTRAPSVLKTQKLRRYMGISETLSWFARPQAVPPIVCLETEIE